MQTPRIAGPQIQTETLPVAGGNRGAGRLVMIDEGLIRDLRNELGSSNISLPDIERRLVARLRSSASREGDARSIEESLTGHLEDTLNFAATYEEKARVASPEATLYQRQSEGFHNTAQRTK